MVEGVGVSDEQLDEWERLAAAASPAPWFFAYSSVRSQPKLGPEEKYWDERADDNHTYERLEACESCGGRGCSLAGEALDMDSRVAGVTASYGDTATGQRQADAEFIAATRDALPALVGEVRASHAREAEALAALAEFTTEAVEDVDHWGSYAGDYFAEKWDLAGCLRKWRSRRETWVAALAGTGDTE